MKFTEGYWLRSESIKPSFVSQAFSIEKTDVGMRVIAPERPIKSRCDAQNITTIIIDFIPYTPNNIAVQLTHYQGYDNREPRFALKGEAPSFTVEVNEKEGVLKCGNVLVRVNRENGQYQFENNENKVITSCDFRNQGYIRTEYQPSTMRPEKNYLADDYKPYMLTELSLKAGERVYGFGEQFTSFCKNGQVVECWRSEERRVGKEC